MSEDIRSKMRELEKQVEYHMHLYYDLDAPELEDYEYDRLIHSLMDLEEQYPQYASPNSPTKRVGGKAQNTFREVTHKVQMGSLQDVFSIDELRAFDARVREVVPNPIYVVEQKIDGLSVSQMRFYRQRDRRIGNSVRDLGERIARAGRDNQNIEQLFGPDRFDGWNIVQNIFTANAAEYGNRFRRRIKARIQIVRVEGHDRR